MNLEEDANVFFPKCSEEAREANISPKLMVGHLQKRLQHFEYIKSLNL